MKDFLNNQFKKVKESSSDLMLLDDEKRQIILQDLAVELRKSSAKIIEENKKDLALMDVNDPKYDRLLLSEERINSIASDVELVAKLPSPLAKILEEKKLENGLKIKKVVVPLGVVAVIYESRPNVTIDSFVLCFKSGNACLLKGGKEAGYSNQILVAIVRKILNKHKLDEHLVYLLPPEREALNLLLKATQFVDVCIPRGSQSLIDFVRENARIPFIETGAGIVHIYFDESADSKKGCLVVENAKTRRVSVCNALDCLIIHEKRLKDLPEIAKKLADKNVEIYADLASHKALENHYPKPLLYQAKPEDFGREFLSYKMSIKTVHSIEEAVQHIKQYSSGHSEAIIAEDKKVIDYFLKHIDAAAVYVNASTAFTDGGQFGMGAEIGISTQKLHVRGPMGLEALTSYKWVIFGEGHVRD